MFEIVDAFQERARRRRARKEARNLVKHVRHHLKKHVYRLHKEAAADLTAAANTLDDAVTRDDHDALCDGLVKLDDLTDRHLSFARKSTFREYADSIAVAVLVALFLRAFVVEAFKIPSGSMIPTMEVGDHIFVNKFLYGIRIPFTNIKLFEWRKPRRGEVIVFVYPVDPSKDFIKRIIGVAGDVIQVKNHTVFVNGKPVPHEEQPGGFSYWDYDEDSDRWTRKDAFRAEERQGDGPYMTLERSIDDIDGPWPKGDLEYRRAHPDCAQKPCVPDDAVAADWDKGFYVVPKGKVFVMGDNRDNSHDSRYWGSVPLENIKGKALIVWWSSGGPEGVRWNRLGKRVERRESC
jgi:signal peptidase I